MKLSDWKSREKLCNRELADLSGIYESKMDRIVRSNGCIKLSDAYKIIKMTKGEVNFADLHLEGDC